MSRTPSQPLLHVTTGQKGRNNTSLLDDMEEERSKGFEASIPLAPTAGYRTPDLFGQQTELVINTTNSKVKNVFKDHFTRKKDKSRPVQLTVAAEAKLYQATLENSPSSPGINNFAQLSREFRNQKLNSGSLATVGQQQISPKLLSQLTQKTSSLLIKKRGASPKREDSPRKPPRPVPKAELNLPSDDSNSIQGKLSFGSTKQDKNRFSTGFEIKPVDPNESMAGQTNNVEIDKPPGVKPSGTLGSEKGNSSKQGEFVRITKDRRIPKPPGIKPTRPGQVRSNHHSPTTPMRRQRMPSTSPSFAIRTVDSRKSTGSPQTRPRNHHRSQFGPSDEAKPTIQVMGGTDDSNQQSEDAEGGPPLLRSAAIVKSTVEGDDILTVSKSGHSKDSPKTAATPQFVSEEQPAFGTLLGVDKKQYGSGKQVSKSSGQIGLVARSLQETNNVDQKPGPDPDESRAENPELDQIPKSHEDFRNCSIIEQVENANDLSVIPRPKQASGAQTHDQQSSNYMHQEQKHSENPKYSLQKPFNKKRTRKGHNLRLNKNSEQSGSGSMAKIDFSISGNSRAGQVRQTDSLQLGSKNEQPKSGSESPGRSGLKAFTEMVRSKKFIDQSEDPKSPPKSPSHKHLTQFHVDQPLARQNPLRDSMFAAELDYLRDRSLLGATAVQLNQSMDWNVGNVGERRSSQFNLSEITPTNPQKKLVDAYKNTKYTSGTGQVPVHLLGRVQFSTQWASQSAKKPYRIDTDHKLNPDLEAQEQQPVRGFRCISWQNTPKRSRARELE